MVLTNVYGCALTIRATMPAMNAGPRRAKPGVSNPMTSQHRTIGSLLRALRARNDWTLKEMSERCGIPLSTLSKVEHDRLTLTYDKLLQLSQRLNIRMSELFAEQDESTEPAVTARRRRPVVGTLAGAAAPFDVHDHARSGAHAFARQIIKPAAPAEARRPSSEIRGSSAAMLGTSCSASS